MGTAVIRVGLDVSVLMVRVRITPEPAHILTNSMPVMTILKGPSCAGGGGATAVGRDKRHRQVAVCTACGRRALFGTPPVSKTPVTAVVAPPSRRPAPWADLD